jgi:hypothetical protein
MTVSGMHRPRVARPGALLVAFLLLAGCAGLEAYEPRNDRVEGPDQGLFTGESREFVIHRRTVRSDESTEAAGL